MTTEMTHEQCSELLRDYAQEQLDGRAAEAVEEHLATCADCSEELAGLAALLAPADASLTEFERARIERGVAWELGDVIPAGRDESRLWTKVAAGLGAAALLAIVGVGIVQLGTGGGGDDSGAGGSAVNAPAANDSERGTGTNADVAAGAAAGAEAAPAPRPSFERRTLLLTDKKLSALGKKSSQFDAFSHSYSTKDAVRLKDEYTTALATSAPTVDQQSNVRQCVQRVYDSTGSYSLLPAYAADARVDGREALVLGFAWTNRAAGPLDQYMLWVWPVGPCDNQAVPIDYRFGQIGKK